MSLLEFGCFADSMVGTDSAVLLLRFLLKNEGPNSRKVLPTFRTSCPEGVPECPDGVSFCPLSSSCPAGSASRGHCILARGHLQVGEVNNG